MKYDHLESVCERFKGATCTVVPREGFEYVVFEFEPPLDEAKAADFLHVINFEGGWLPISSDFSVSSFLTTRVRLARRAGGAE